MNKGKTFSIFTIGCKTNQFESSSIAGELLRRGYMFADSDKAADIYIINSCTVTSRADADTRKLIRRAATLNPKALKVLTGCFVQVSPEDAANIEGVDIVAGNSSKDILVDLIDKADGSKQIKVIPFQGVISSTILPLEISTERTRVFLQIQNGCDAFCSYCIVPYSRGACRSVPPEQIIDTINRLSLKYREIVLTGIHIGKYGVESDNRVNLAALLNRINSECSAEIIRLGSIEPNELNDELIETISAIPSIAPHLHIPLQSGSDTILKSMNRNYSKTFFAERLNLLKSSISNITIGIDIIAGFPGETDDQHLESATFLESLPYEYAHVFPYSRRKGTVADKLEDHIKSDVIKKRAAQLRRISEIKKDEWHLRMIGKKERVLIQEETDKGTFRGISESYLPVEVINSKISTGEIHSVCYKSKLDGVISGYVAKN